MDSEPSQTVPSQTKEVKATTKQNVPPEFLIKHRILPSPPKDITNWKKTYLSEAINLWKQRQVNERIDPESVSNYIPNYKKSDKLCNDKGQGKF